MILTVLIVIIIALLIGVILVFYGSLLMMIFLPSPYVPLKRKDVKRLYQLCQPQADQLVYDLGSGDGRILIYGARQYGIRGVGCELLLYPLLISYLKILFYRLKSRIKIRWQSFYQINLNLADVVICYLFPEVMSKLKNKFEKELRPGTKVISCGFAIPGWQPKVYDKPSRKNVGIYLYQK